MTTSQPSTDPRRPGSAALWASAFVLVALIVVQLGRMPAGAGKPPAAGFLTSAALAVPGEVSRAGEYTVLTLNAGNEDVLAVLDGRGEELYVYRVKQMNQLEFVSRDSLAQLFTTARRTGK